MTSPNIIDASNECLSKRAGDFPRELLIAEIIRLRDCIRKHYESSIGHNMCWENDEELWKTALGQDLKYRHSTMPSQAEMLQQCSKYIESRLRGLPYQDPEPKTFAVTRDGKRIIENKD